MLVYNITENYMVIDVSSGSVEPADCWEITGMEVTETTTGEVWSNFGQLDGAPAITEMR